MFIMGNQPFYPGQILGVIGGGYSALRLVMAAKLMGYKVGAYGPSPSDDALQLADFMIIGAHNDREQLKHFAEECDFVAYVGDMIDSSVIEFISQYTNVPQGQNILEIIQDRLLERAFFDQINVNIAPYVTIVGLDDVYGSIDSIGYPAVIRPIQHVRDDDSLVISRSSDIAKAADFIDTGTFVLESYIPHTREFSLIITKGETDVAFPIIEKSVIDNQLVSAKLAQLNQAVVDEMTRIGTETVNGLTGLGSIEIEFYLTGTDALYLKGIKPGICLQANLFDTVATVDQYTQFLTAIAGAPLKEIKIMQSAVLKTFEASQIKDLKTQWVLKSNWFYFMYPVPIKTKVGHIIVTGDSVDKIEMQIDNTEMWSFKKESE